ncbi:siepin [Schizosaccharomyces cryophilus OY26]|uniref:Siepin n=1 Tax=Schizosaccharomyces cryophilus (strain OY26 / ATCC MYA-4695 / CBS 11777 / NBRC 106824 / NRRL Y48691) TaxID=653667 RepID=S9VYI1_SCHCR|nr:siepin [Schizosaccharomyces cryophilus OY26]EPY52728.1 siepin [Schizosaccharomyces cryophilus OY26]
MKLWLRSFIGGFKLFVGILIIVLFSIPSLVSYIIFYDTVIPHAVVQYPVYFNYTTGSDYPYAKVNLDHFSIDPRLPGTSILQLSIPRSRRNREVGNFMISVDFHGRTEQTTIKSVSRTVLFPHYSSIHEQLKLVLCFPLYLAGILEERDTVSVKLLESEMFGKHRSAINTLSSRFYVGDSPKSASIHIHSKDIEFYDATLAFASKLHGMRWFMYTHKVSAFFVFTALFWFTGICTTFITYLIISSTSKSRKRVA